MASLAKELAGRFGALTASQISGFTALATATAGLPLLHRAYILATAWHETAFTMKPVREYGGAAYFRKYEPGTVLGKELGNTRIGDGYKFRGRGFAQITGRRNYTTASKIVGRNLVAAPDLALDPILAAKVIVSGMTEGWFTGKKLADYSDYLSMRRTVNGTDKAVAIAGYARKIEEALRQATTVSVSLPPAPKPKPKPVSPKPRLKRISAYDRLVRTSANK